MQGVLRPGNQERAGGGQEMGRGRRVGTRWAVWGEGICQRHRWGCERDLSRTLSSVSWPE